VTLQVTGKASQLGRAPERCLNAVYGLSHPMLQTQNFSDPSRGPKMNGTMVSGGTKRNVIPAEATAAPGCGPPADHRLLTRVEALRR
jgi:glutamate carboxypeptidase